MGWRRRWRKARARREEPVAYAEAALLEHGAGAIDAVLLAPPGAPRRPATTRRWTRSTRAGRRLARHGGDGAGERGAGRRLRRASPLPLGRSRASRRLPRATRAGWPMPVAFGAAARRHGIPLREALPRLACRLRRQPGLGRRAAGPARPDRRAASSRRRCSRPGRATGWRRGAADAGRRSAPRRRCSTSLSMRHETQYTRLFRS